MNMNLYLMAVNFILLIGIIAVINRIEKNKLLTGWKKEIWRHKELILISLIFFIAAIFADYYAGNYVTEVGTALAPDLIHQIIPPADLSFIFVYGIVLIIAILFGYPIFFDIKKIHLTIGHFSLLVMVRSISMSLTHLKTPITAITPEFPEILRKLVFENDLFFSGHVAIPFMGFLLFRNSKIKWFFLASSIIMAITVLIMHRHYSIDVISAFFIAYGTFKIGEKLFHKLEKFNSYKNKL